MSTAFCNSKKNSRKQSENGVNRLLLHFLHGELREGLVYGDSAENVHRCIARKIGKENNGKRRISKSPEYPTLIELIGPVKFTTAC